MLDVEDRADQGAGGSDRTRSTEAARVAVEGLAPCRKGRRPGCDPGEGRCDDRTMNPRCPPGSARGRVLPIDRQPEVRGADRGAACLSGHTEQVPSKAWDYAQSCRSRLKCPL